MKLSFIEESASAIGQLYQLLKQRTPEQSIKHTTLPQFEQHVAYVQSKPHLCWYMIDVPDEFGKDRTVGTIYLTTKREIGIFIFEGLHRNGYATDALKMLIEMHPGKFVANINPKNEPSNKLFEKLGFTHIQNTYELKQ